MITAWTTHWDDQKENLKELQYCLVTKIPGKFRSNVEVLYSLWISQATDNQVRDFFNKVSKDIEKRGEGTCNSFCQFYAVGEEGVPIPVVWYWIKSSSSRFAVKHDRAFNQTLITKVFDTVSVSCTRLNLQRKRLRRSRCSSLKYTRDAYKCMANLFGRNK